MVFLISCLMTCQAFALEYINPDLPLPDEYYDSWGTASSGFVDPWGDFSSGFGSMNITPEVSTPVITCQPEPYFGTKGEVPHALSVEASGFDGMLCFQWYMSYTGTFNDLYPINGACSSVYTPNQVLGTAYYCVGVYNVNGNLRSEEVYSNIVPVSYAGIQITNAPYTLHYTVGSSVDLSGLAVTVYDGYSTSWQSFDGSGLNVYPSVFNSVGRVAVEVSYNGSSDVFYVSVGAGGNGKPGTPSKNGDGTVTAEDGEVVAADGSHVHSFGEWEVTKPATCVTTGIETRTCECGEAETREIPRTDHAWDEGVVTKEPTDTSNGARLYTCTICKANKSEIIPAGTASSAEINKKVESLNIDQGGSQAPENTTKNAAVTGKVDSATTGANEVTAVAAGNVNNKGDGSGWWLIPVSALVLVGTGTGAYYVMRKKGDQQ